MGLFSRSSSDRAAEAILTLDLSHNQTDRWQAVDTLHELPPDAIRTAMGELPADTKGAQVANACALKAEQNARDSRDGRDHWPGTNR